MVYIGEQKRVSAGSSMRTIRIGLVVGRSAFSDTIVRQLRSQPGFEVLFSVFSVDDLPSQAAELDVVVLDTVLRDGFSTRRNIRVLSDFGIGVIAYAQDGRRQVLRTALRGGARAVFSGEQPVEELVAAIRRVAEVSLGLPVEGSAPAHCR